MAKAFSLNHKFLFIIIAPLMLSLISVLAVTYFQFQSLAQQAQQSYRLSVTEDRKRALKNYVSIVRGAVEHLYQDPTISELEAQRQVRQILNTIAYDLDGYFYAYDYQGVNIVLPGQEWRAGRNFYHLSDGNGVKIIQSLIEQGRSGGGYSQYVFAQPSHSGAEGKKIAYSEALDNWQWVIGTGVYIDDIEQQVTAIEHSIGEHINHTFLITLLIGGLAIILVFISGLFIVVSEKRIADSKLRELNERIFQSQEEQATRFARELHDGVNQELAAAKFAIETAQLKQQHQDDNQEELTQAIALISQVTKEVRAISHQLHPSILEDHGLCAALEELGRLYAQRTGTIVNIDCGTDNPALSTDVKSALYRIGQEAVTNIERHANASEVTIRLKQTSTQLVLEVTDNGNGFDYDAVENTALVNQGIGLRNMRERLHYYHGELTVHSNGEQTRILAAIPLERRTGCSCHSAN